MRRIIATAALVLAATACGPVREEVLDEQPQTEPAVETGTAKKGIHNGPGWYYVTWPTAGLRRWNPSGCGGTVHCTLFAGDWVYWGGTVGSCDSAPYDAYVSQTPCGFSGWVRADALN